MLRAGLTPSGTTEPKTINEIAKHLGIATSSVITHQAFAESKVYKHINLHLIRSEQTRRTEEIIFPPANTDTITYHDELTTRYTNPGAANTHGGIKLGDGSEAMTRAAKHGGERTRTATIKAHQQYARS
jgi:hypothetical protein